MTNTEDLIISNNGDLKNKPDLLKSIDEYQEELKEIFKTYKVLLILIVLSGMIVMMAVIRIYQNYLFPIYLTITLRNIVML